MMHLSCLRKMEAVISKYYIIWSNRELDNIIPPGITVIESIRFSYTVVVSVAPISCPYIFQSHSAVSIVLRVFNY